MTASSDVWFKQPTVIKFLFTEYVKPVDIHTRLLVIYWNETLVASSIRCWALQVKHNEVGKKLLSPMRIEVDYPLWIVNGGYWRGLQAKIDDLVQANRKLSNKK